MQIWQLFVSTANDYQARRVTAAVVKQRENRFLHTLNGSGLVTSRLRYAPAVKLQTLIRRH